GGIEGCIYTPTNSSQIGRLSNPLDYLDKFKINSWHSCDAHQLRQPGSKQNLSAPFSAPGGRVQPA
ncbi:FAD-dependent oxidoreductase, partial [Pseudoalteromonas sp. S1609]